MEMIFLDGTPATCASIALHNLYPPNSFDLLISGPNFGRNTSSSFALSSGTLGAALAGSLSSCPGIALSWGLMEGYKPPKDEFIDAAVETSCRVVQKLYELGWGGGGGGRDKVDVYSVNVPVRLLSLSRLRCRLLIKKTELIELPPIISSCLPSSRTLKSNGLQWRLPVTVDCLNRFINLLLLQRLQQQQERQKLMMQVQLLYLNLQQPPQQQRIHRQRRRRKMLKMNHYWSNLNISRTLCNSLSLPISLIS